MKITFLILLIAFQTLVAGIDVKTLEMQTKSTQYPELLNVLFNISIHHYITNDSINLSKYANIALNLTEEHSDMFRRIDALNNLSFVISYRDHKKAKEYAEEAYKLAVENSYSYGQCLALFLKACSIETEEPAKSLELYQQAINLAISTGRNDIKALSEAAIGDYYSRKGSISNALKYYISAIRVFEKLPDLNTNLMFKYLHGELLNNLGVSYKKLKNHNEAINYYEKYKSISVEMENVWGTSVALNNLGVIYYNQNDYKSAISNFNEARIQFQKIGAVSLIPTIDNNLGNIYSTLGSFVESQKYYESALSQFKVLNNDIGIARCLASLGDLYLLMKKYPESRKMFQSAIDVIKDKDLEIQTASNLGLSSVYDSIKQYSEAFHYYKIYTKLKDSLSNNVKSEEITLMTQGYKEEKLLETKDRLRQEEEKKQNEAKARKHNLEYMGILIIILFSFSFIFFYGKLKISTTRLESIVFIALLFLFTFISVMTDPFVDNLTKGDPLFKLLINALLALVLTPLDTFLEKIIRRRVIAPN